MYNIHETRTFSGILFIRHKIFICNMQEDDDLLVHVNNVKALADQFTCLEVFIKNDLVMTCLPPSYKHLITILKMMPIKKLTMKQQNTQFYRTSFDTYEVIVSLNVYLDDVSFMETVKINSIIIVITMKIIKKNHIKNAFHVPKMSE